MQKTPKTERKLNKVLSAAGIFLAVLSVMLLSVLSVPAAEESGSLTLRCVFTVEDGERVLPNDDYSLVKIADAVITGSSVSYTTRDQFKSYDCDWKNVKLSAMNEKAKELAAFCKEKGYYTATRTTDAKGELKFDHLERGLYLVARTKVDPANEDFVTDPLLFFIPQDVNGEAFYDMIATPKFSYLKSGDPSLPQTGQLLWPIVPLALTGCLLILIGTFLLKKKEDAGEK